ncbi:MAG: hypothetical protein P8Z78_11005 [Gammaproteobacteria bacterium]|jgi:Ca2+-binding EF-hand superfamily protein
MKPLIPLFLTLLCPLLATADESRPGAGDAFLHHYDSDRDGKVSLAEFQAPAEKQFMLMDTDGDGSITAEEAAAFVQRMRDEMMKEREQE